MYICNYEAYKARHGARPRGILLVGKHVGQLIRQRDVL